MCSEIISLCSHWIWELKAIFEKSVLGDEIVHELLYHEGEKEYIGEDDIPFFQGQTRLVLKRCGHIDAEDIHEYIASGGYQSLAKALFDMKPDDIVNEIYESNPFLKENQEYTMILICLLN